MRKYLIERDLPGIGAMSPAELGAASRRSNEALAELSPSVLWQQSYIAGDKTYCVYLAEDVGAINRHAELSGFPVSEITEIRNVIDPATAGIA